MKRQLLKVIVGIVLTLAVAVFFTACAPMDSYTVSFNLGDYNGTPPEDIEVSAGEEVTLPDVGVTREGYTFEGWTLPGNATVYKPSDSYEVNSDLTFTAKWKKDDEEEKKDVTATFSLGEDVEGKAPDAITKKEGESIVLPSATREGYTLEGWTLDGDSKVYKAGESYTLNASVTFTAKWKKDDEEEKKDVTATFSLGDGVEGKAPDAITKKEGESIVLPSATREGYTLEGWTLEGDNKVYKAGESYTLNASVTFTAKWTKNDEEKKDVTATFSLGDGVEGKAPDAITKKAGESIELPNATREGYTLFGWTLEGDNKVYKAGESYTLNSSVTFTAKWLKDGETLQPTWLEGNWVYLNPYTYEFYVITFADDVITFEINSQTTSGSATNEKKVSTSYIYDGNNIVEFTAIDPDDDKKFEWNYVITRLSETSLKLELITENGRNELGQFQKLQEQGVENVTATFDLGDDVEDEPPASITKKKGESIELPEAEREGYTLEGWTIENSETVYKAGDSYTLNASVKFTAKWKENIENPKQKFTVTYELGDGATGTTPEAQEVEKDTVITLPTTNAVKEGYVFDGWTLDDGTEYAVGDQYTVTASVTFTAKWKANNTEDSKNISWLIGEWKGSVTTPVKFAYTISYDGNSIKYQANMDSIMGEIQTENVTSTKIEIISESVVTFEGDNNQKYRITKTDDTIKLERISDTEGESIICENMTKQSSSASAINEVLWIDEKK